MSEDNRKLPKMRVGLRGSQLSLRQGEILAELLSPDEMLAVVIKTTGDRRSIDPSSINSAQDKFEWIKEIESQLLVGKIELALHSAKDVPVTVAPETILFPLPKPASRFDMLITSGAYPNLEALPRASRIGTSSARRTAQLLAIRPDLELVPLRGNIGTRLEKLGSLSLEGLVLAQAGLERLSITPSNFIPLEPPNFLPAVNQGILLAQVRADNKKLVKKLKELVCSRVNTIFTAERACIASLGADCHSAVGILADYTTSGQIELSCRVMSRSGSKLLFDRISGKPESASLLGKELADKLLYQGAACLLAGVED